MRTLARAVLFAAAATVCCADQLASLRADLQNLKLDDSATWHVRELEIAKGSTKLFLSEGVLAFATPVAGHRIAAVFATENMEGGDGEIVAFPPNAAERASLFRFAKTPNLDEHFNFALLFFGADTAQELMNQMNRRPLRPAHDLDDEIKARLGSLLRSTAREVEVPLAQSILDRHKPSEGFLYSMMSGKSLGLFDFIYQPDQVDAEILGKVVQSPDKHAFFEMWCGYGEQGAAQPGNPHAISDYRIQTAIHSDLSMTANAEFDYQAAAENGRAIKLMLTPRMQVLSATVDGQEAGVLMHESARTADIRGATSFLVVNNAELAPGTHHRVSIRYEGSVIRRTAGGNYFVDDRNAWYPFVAPMLTVFDLTYQVPAELRLVSTGERISEQVAGEERTIHCKTRRPEALAGFNLGRFDVTLTQAPPYQVEICSNPQAAPPPDLASQTERILQKFTSWWMPLDLHTIAVTPIEGYFGQGFPGLIYLSDVSFVPEENRPANLRNAMLDSFFSQLLLPHELAHQWWGNMLAPDSYQSGWIVEAMANYAALQYVEQTVGKAAAKAVLEGYRIDLTTKRAGAEDIESFGPLTFDQRLLNNFGARVWHDILYEKGTWVMHMLRERMGDSNFAAFQKRLLERFSERPLSNDDFRKEAASFLTDKRVDPGLTLFFDAWVFGTGVPTLTLKQGRLNLSGVPDGFVVDVPLTCGAKGREWIRASEGTTKVALNCSLPPEDSFLFRE